MLYRRQYVRWRWLCLNVLVCADQEPSMRAKILEAFRTRWFSARTKEDARAPAAELCLIMRALSADRNVLPMPHDFVLRRLLHAILHGDPDLTATRKSAASSSEHARQVPLPLSTAASASRLRACAQQGLLDLIHAVHMCHN